LAVDSREAVAAAPGVARWPAALRPECSAFLSGRVLGTVGLDRCRAVAAVRDEAP
jgi:hypothetical protein